MTLVYIALYSEKKLVILEKKASIIGRQDDVL